MHNNKRHSELLIKLSKGIISEKERWELERASLDDVFLADAIEGFYNNNVQHDLSRIPINSSKPAIKKTEEPLRRNLIKKWIGVAATLLILFSVSFWAINQFENTSSGIYSETNNSKKENIQNSTPIRVPIDNSDDGIIYEEEEVDINKDSRSTIIATSSKTKNKRNKKNVNAKDGSIDLDKEETKATGNFTENNIESEFRKPPVYKKVTKSKSTVIRSLEDIETVPLQLVSGTVRDPNGLPIPNVSLSSLDGSGPVFTDVDGVFEINLKEEESAIIAQADGFVSQEIQAQPKLDIKLKKAVKNLSDAPKLLAELMTTHELKQHYKNVLRKYFKQHSISLCNEAFKSRNNIKLLISISDSNTIEHIKHLNVIDTPCQMSIENIIDQASQENIFDGSQRVSFTFDLDRF